VKGGTAGRGVENGAWRGDFIPGKDIPFQLKKSGGEIKMQKKEFAT